MHLNDDDDDNDITWVLQETSNYQQTGNVAEDWKTKRTWADFSSLTGHFHALLSAITETYISQ